MPEPAVGHTEVRTLDGLRLSATLTRPAGSAGHAVVMVHGGGVTREEGGFFTRLAEGLAATGTASLRYDLRGHGESDGRPEESSLAAHLNDIRVVLDHLRGCSGVRTASLLGASFGGGLAAYYAAESGEQLERVVLLNPQLDFKKRYIDQKDHWRDGHLSDDKADELVRRGYIDHSPTVRHSRAFLNEAFWIRPRRVLGGITAPTLLVHGTEDTFVPVAGSRDAVAQLPGESRLVEIDGAEHGFAVHADPGYLDPQSQEWQRYVVGIVGEWLTDGRLSSGSP
ncbi:alpha/beta hydrolase [Pseudonocardia sp. EC080610-09]|uniref:alpha/beta hydrolase n=1 Tax=unclassified Pseudonocardia TaxID=2619320 RepID=UPI0006CB0C89|nr:MULTISPECIES: alpha/beta fold hydrolase [unclassified Pseudonocardia]ALE72239.1 alpha/beta hydrolase [Pseudonocardia sp. EC080625-04]ALL75522.1 alpha/beta hydrolase [Pseudonocardia sp. EC080610-09]ALL82549.1 alpha/beta hydrolase [Pseudonocardia sp. EC080619-01]